VTYAAPPVTYAAPPVTYAAPPSKAMPQQPYTAPPPPPQTYGSPQAYGSAPSASYQGSLPPNPNPSTPNSAKP
jgi:hypothetical protein